MANLEGERSRVSGQVARVGTEAARAGEKLAEVLPEVDRFRELLQKV